MKRRRACEALLASIPVGGKSVERLGEAESVFTLGLTIPAERFVTVSLEEDVLVTEDGFLSGRLSAN